jgi:hypothetical protein
MFIFADMKPEEKAVELVEKYLRIEDDTTFYWEPYYDRKYIDDEVLDHAKKCALIAVDEIIEWLSPFEGCPAHPYWQEVKNEINKL